MNGVACNRILLPVAHPGNAFYIRYCPRWSGSAVIYGVPCSRKTSRGVAQPAEFIRELGNQARRRPVAFLVAFRKHKHGVGQGRQVRGQGDGQEEGAHVGRLSLQGDARQGTG